MGVIVFPKQTDVTDDLDKDYIDGLARSIRGFGCHFCCLVKIVSKFLGIDMTISITNLIDIAYHAILAGKMVNDNKPIIAGKDWNRCWIPNTVEFCKWLASYWDQRIKVALTKVGDADHPIKSNIFRNKIAGSNFAEIEYKDEKYQHFVESDNPQSDKLIFIDYNPDPRLNLFYVISIRYLTLTRA